MHWVPYTVENSYEISYVLFSLDLFLKHIQSQN